MTSHDSMTRPVNTSLTSAVRLTQASLQGVLTAALAISLSSCRPATAPASPPPYQAADSTDDFHADNDIAMTVRSLADAISVGEPLDTAQYNYEGILTDGQGTPLYTDIQGTPGQWSVFVSSPSHAVIRNIYLGDLLPDDLRMYIASSLSLTDSDIIEERGFDNNESQLVTYSFPGGNLRFESRPGIAPNGLEGPLLSIIVTSAPAAPPTPI